MSADVMISTRSAHLNVAYPAANSTTAGTAVVNPADSFTAPSGGGVIQMGDQGAMTSPGLILIPYGVGSTGNTFLMAVFAADVIKGAPPPTLDTWTQWLLASFTCTMSASATGMQPISGAPNYTSGSYYCDTIVVLNGNANVSCEAVSPTTSVKASVVVDAKGAKYVNILFYMNSSATSANTLWRRV